MGPGDLHKVLGRLNLPADSRLLVGIATNDDAGVYQLTADLALVQTVDFFTPIVDDPHTFGAIAAANAISDLYAMGAQPLTALSIICTPADGDLAVLSQILQGGIDKLSEAGVTLVGGHTVIDPELKCGFAVTGTVDPSQIITNSNAQVGDRLVLTKPLGTGIIATAQKGDVASPESIAAASETMLALNNEAAAQMCRIGVNSCTDVTGFGLLGHLYEMASASNVGIELSYCQIPLLPQANEYVADGLIPGGLQRNREYISAHVQFASSLLMADYDVLFDPQTSGGLLISLLPDKAEKLVDILCSKKIFAAIIGRVVELRDRYITVR